MSATGSHFTQGKACMADSIPEAVEMEHMATCQLFVSGCGCHLFSADDADIVTFQVSRSSIHKHFIHVCRHTPDRSHVHMTFRYHDLNTCMTGCNRSMKMCSGFYHTAVLFYCRAHRTADRQLSPVSQEVNNSVLEVAESPIQISDLHKNVILFYNDTSHNGRCQKANALPAQQSI